MAYERNFSAAGIIRQTSAIVATGDLRQWTRRITAPTLVIHGTADPLVHVERGKDIAAIIPGAKLHLIEDMGHDLPPKHLDTVTNLTLEHVQQSQTASDTRPVA